MSKSYWDFKKQLTESLGLLHTHSYRGKHIHIDKNITVIVDGIPSTTSFKSLHEAIEYTKRYIDNEHLLEETEPISQQRIASYIRKHHDVDKVTNTLIESYVELAHSNKFSVDPVITEMKRWNVNVLRGKIQHTLNDGSVVALEEETQKTLNKLLEGQSELVGYMQQSKHNFMAVLDDLI